jgi:hypothetical protein
MAFSIIVHAMSLAILRSSALVFFVVLCNPVVLSKGFVLTLHCQIRCFAMPLRYSLLLA